MISTTVVKQNKDIIMHSPSTKAEIIAEGVILSPHPHKLRN